MHFFHFFGPIRNKRAEGSYISLVDLTVERALKLEDLTPKQQAEQLEYLSFLSGTSLSQKAGEYGRANRQFKGSKKNKRTGLWYFNPAVYQQEVYRDYARLFNQSVRMGFILLDEHATTKRYVVGPNFGEGVCRSFRFSKRAFKLKRVRNGKALQKLCDAVGKRRASPNEDTGKPRVVRPLVTAEGIVVWVPHKRVNGVLYPMINISNEELIAVLGKNNYKYFDIKSAFPRTFRAVLSTVCPGMLNERLEQTLNAVPAELKSRVLTALFRCRSAKDDPDDRVRAVAAAAKALRRTKEWSKRDFYYALAAECVVPFQEVLIEMDILLVQRVDGAFVSPNADLDEVNRRLHARGFMHLDVREKDV